MFCASRPLTHSLLHKEAAVSLRLLRLFMTDEQAAPQRFKVYTKTGDKGTSSLYTGERRPKDDSIFMALGDTDELNAHIGVAREYCTGVKIASSSAEASAAEATSGETVLGDAAAGGDEAGPDAAELRLWLAEIQSRLMDVGTAIATPVDGRSKAKEQRALFDADHTAALEGRIDRMDAMLPPLRNFILPVRATYVPCLCLSMCYEGERNS